MNVPTLIYSHAMKLCLDVVPDVKLVIYANKQDLPGAATAEEIIQRVSGLPLRYMWSPIGHTKMALYLRQWGSRHCWGRWAKDGTCSRVALTRVMG